MNTPLQASEALSGIGTPAAPRPLGLRHHGSPSISSSSCTVCMTETEQRLFNAIKANFYKGRTPRVARMRSAPQDETAF